MSVPAWGRKMRAASQKSVGSNANSGRAATPPAAETIDLDEAFADALREYLADGSMDLSKGLSFGTASLKRDAAFVRLLEPYSDSTELVEALVHADVVKRTWGLGKSCTFRGLFGKSTDFKSTESVESRLNW